jgi:hypothetical protein
MPEVRSSNPVAPYIKRRLTSLPAKKKQTDQRRHHTAEEDADKGSDKPHGGEGHSAIETVIPHVVEKGPGERLG